MKDNEENFRLQSTAGNYDSIGTEITRGSVPEFVNDVEFGPTSCCAPLKLYRDQSEYLSQSFI